MTIELWTFELSQQIEKLKSYPLLLQQAQLFKKALLSLRTFIEKPEFAMSDPIPLQIMYLSLNASYLLTDLKLANHQYTSQDRAYLSPLISRLDICYQTVLQRLSDSLHSFYSISLLKKIELLYKQWLQKKTETTNIFTWDLFHQHVLQLAGSAYQEVCESTISAIKKKLTEFPHIKCLLEEANISVNQQKNTRNFFDKQLKNATNISSEQLKNGATISDDWLENMIYTTFHHILNALFSDPLCARNILKRIQQTLNLSNACQKLNIQQIENQNDENDPLIDFYDKACVPRAFNIAKLLRNNPSLATKPKTPKYHETLQSLSKAQWPKELSLTFFFLEENPLRPQMFTYLKEHHKLYLACGIFIPFYVFSATSIVENSISLLNAPEKYRYPTSKPLQPGDLNSSTILIILNPPNNPYGIYYIRPHALTISKIWKDKHSNDFNLKAANNNNLISAQNCEEIFVLTDSTLGTFTANDSKPLAEFLEIVFQKLTYYAHFTWFNLLNIDPASEALLALDDLAAKEKLTNTRFTALKSFMTQKVQFPTEIEAHAQNLLKQENQTKILPISTLSAFSRIKTSSNATFAVLPSFVCKGDKEGFKVDLKLAGHI